MLANLTRRKNLLYRTYTTKAKRSLLKQDQTKIKGKFFR